MAILTLLTDFGTRDYYVAAVKGVILSAAPATTIIDISHEVAPGDIAEAGFLLVATAPSFPPGTLHLAVVDPGVGSERRLLLVETADARFIAPDNGLLTPWLDRGTTRAIERPDLYREAPGATFHGRDRLAPVAGALLGGEEPDRLGKEIADAVRLRSEPARRDGPVIQGSVIHVDRFGNLVTDIPAAWLMAGGTPRLLELEVSGRRAARWVSHYEELTEDEVGALAGSLGTVELSLRGRSLAERWETQRGGLVRIWKDPAKRDHAVPERSG